MPADLVEKKRNQGGLGGDSIASIDSGNENVFFRCRKCGHEADETYARECLHSEVRFLRDSDPEQASDGEEQAGELDASQRAITPVVQLSASLQFQVDGDVDAFVEAHRPLARLHYYFFGAAWIFFESHILENPSRYSAANCAKVVLLIIDGIARLSDGDHPEMIRFDAIFAWIDNLKSPITITHFV